MYFFRVKLGLNGEPLQGPYLDKLAHIQVVINCRYSIAQMCTREDTLARYLGESSLDDIMSHNELTTILKP